MFATVRFCFIAFLFYISSIGSVGKSCHTSNVLFDGLVIHWGILWAVENLFWWLYAL